VAALGKREQRQVLPHVSIARPRSRATDVDREAGLRWATALDLRAINAHLDRIALYTWAEVRKDRLFRIVAEQMLEPSADPLSPSS
jgi:2'-5' RNA ligase